MHEMFAPLGLPDDAKPMGLGMLYAVVPVSAGHIQDLGADAMAMADRLALDTFRRVATEHRVVLDESTVRRHSAIASALVDNGEGEQVYADIMHSIYGPPVFIHYPADLKPARFTIYWTAEIVPECTCTPAYTETDSPELVRDPDCPKHPDQAQYSEEAPF